MNMDSHQVSENIHFHNFGVDNVETIDITTGWTMKRLSTIMKELGHEEVFMTIMMMVMLLLMVVVMMLMMMMMVVVVVMLLLMMMMMPVK